MHGHISVEINHHINLLELIVVRLVQQKCLPLMKGKDVLVRTGSKMVVAYINRQGGVHSPALRREWVKLWLWATPNLGSLRALHIPGLVNKEQTSLEHALAHRLWPLTLLYAFLLPHLIAPFINRVKKEKMSVGLSR